MSASTSGVSEGPTKFLMARPTCTRSPGSAEEAAVGIERTQDGQLVVGGRLGGEELLGLSELEAGVGADGLERDPAMESLHPHAPGLGIEAEDPERGHHARDTAEEQPGTGPAGVAGQPGGAGDEIDARDEAALLVGGEDDDLTAQRRDVVGAAG